MPGSFCFDNCCGTSVCNTILYANMCGFSQDGTVITVAGVGSLTVNNAISGGQVLFSIPSAGTYTVSATIRGIPCSGDLFLGCDGGAPNTGLDVWWIEIQGCTGPLEGAVVSVAGFADQTTDVDGRVYYCLPFVLNLVSSYAFTVTYPGFTTYSDTWDGASCPTVILTVDPAYECLTLDDCGCNVPFPIGTTLTPLASTLAGNDSVLGPVTMTDSGLGYWTGSLTVDIAACGSCPAQTGVIVNYKWPAASFSCAFEVSVLLSSGCPHGGVGGGTVITPAVQRPALCDPFLIETLYDQCNCAGGGSGCAGRQIWPGTGRTTVSLTR